jgi:hypothetical protein
MRGLRNWSLLLILAALVCGAAAARYSARHKDDPETSVGGPDLRANVSQESNRDEATAFEPLRAEQVTTGEAIPPRERTETFQEWYRKYRAANGDDRQLRRDLEAALAQLPGDATGRGNSGAEAAFEALRRAEQTVGDDYAAWLDQLERFLASYGDSVYAAEVREMFHTTARQWDDRDFDSAREFSLQQPDLFEGRISRFERYLERHGVAGRHVADATAAIQSLRTEWSEHDYRSIHEFYRQYPNDLVTVASRVRQFLAVHASSHRVQAANDFLAKYERAATPHDYRIRVKSGVFDRSIKHTLSLGPDLAVEIEVAGVRIGRTPIVADSFEPVWNYEFPQTVRWRMGDRVQVRVVDFDYSNRTIVKFDSADDPLALRYLSGTIKAQGHQLAIECEFQIPTLPSP